MSGPLGVFPVKSDHGDVHQLIVARSNGDSLTIDDYRRVVAAVTGHELPENEIEFAPSWFAEEDR